MAGKVRRCSGAWKTAGEWWAATAWSREEWDVELEGGGLYRLSRERTTWQWYVEGVYD
jgi:protein ImuB